VLLTDALASNTTFESLILDDNTLSDPSMLERTNAPAENAGSAAREVEMNLNMAADALTTMFGGVATSVPSNFAVQDDTEGYVILRFHSTCNQYFDQWSWPTSWLICWTPHLRGTLHKMLKESDLLDKRGTFDRFEQQHMHWLVTYRSASD